LDFVEIAQEYYVFRYALRRKPAYNIAVMKPISSIN